MTWGTSQNSDYGRSSSATKGTSVPQSPIIPDPPLLLSRPCDCGRPAVIQIGLVAGVVGRSFCIRHLGAALDQLTFLLDSGVDELEGDE